MAISAEDQIIHHLKDKVGLAEADRLVAQLKRDIQAAGEGSLRDRLAAVVASEVGSPPQALVRQLADLVDEARIRGKQDALYSSADRATEK